MQPFETVGGMRATTLKHKQEPRDQVYRAGDGPQPCTWHMGSAKPDHDKNIGYRRNVTWHPLSRKEIVEARRTRTGGGWGAPNRPQQHPRCGSRGARIWCCCATRNTPSRNHSKSGGRRPPRRKKDTEPEHAQQQQGQKKAPRGCV